MWMSNEIFVNYVLANVDCQTFILWDEVFKRRCIEDVAKQIVNQKSPSMNF